MKCYNIYAFGVWRSLVSRLVRDQEASGSNPDTPTKIVGTAFAVPTIFICGGIKRVAPVTQTGTGKRPMDTCLAVGNPLIAGRTP